MAEPTIISWTPANWITVILMVSVAFVVVAAIAKIKKQRNANASS
jgi:urea transporter